MKKFIMFIGAAIIAASLVSCGNNTPKAVEENVDSVEVAVDTVAVETVAE